MASMPPRLQFLFFLLVALIFMISSTLALRSLNDVVNIDPRCQRGFIQCKQLWQEQFRRESEDGVDGSLPEVLNPEDARCQRQMSQCQQRCSQRQQPYRQQQRCLERCREQYRGGCASSTYYKDEDEDDVVMEAEVNDHQDHKDQEMEESTQGRYQYCQRRCRERQWDRGQTSVRECQRRCQQEYYPTTREEDRRWGRRRHEHDPFDDDDEEEEEELGYDVPHEQDPERQLQEECQEACQKQGAGRQKYRQCQRRCREQYQQHEKEISEKEQGKGSAAGSSKEAGGQDQEEGGKPWRDVCRRRCSWQERTRGQQWQCQRRCEERYDHDQELTMDQQQGRGIRSYDETIDDRRTRLQITQVLLH